MIKNPRAHADAEGLDSFILEYGSAMDHALRESGHTQVEGLTKVGNDIVDLATMTMGELMNAEKVEIPLNTMASMLAFIADKLEDSGEMADVSQLRAAHDAIIARLERIQRSNESILRLTADTMSSQYKTMSTNVHDLVVRSLRKRVG